MIIGNEPTGLLINSHVFVSTGQPVPSVPLPPNVTAVVGKAKEASAPAFGVGGVVGAAFTVNCHVVEVLSVASKATDFTI